MSHGSRSCRMSRNTCGAACLGDPVRVGFYGHGAFVTSAEVQYDTLFVAALGVAADMDVMVFPQWRFPEKNPLVELPWDILLGQLNNLLQNPAETVVDTI